MNLSNLVHELALTGGFSYNVNTGESNPSNGYMVSLLGNEQQFFFDDFDNKDLKNYFFSHSEQLAKPESFLGGWLDGNRVYLDVSINIQDIENAIYTGICNSQKSIYDCANKNYINLPLPQMSGTMTQNRTYNRLKAREIAYQVGLSKA
jgi:hypothetical protein